jgi:hypothetical protein
MPWSPSDCAFALIRALGVLFVCAALFLYENEEGRIQNKLEEWWIRLSDRGKEPRSWAAAFMQDVADSTGRGFDRLLGKRLLSLRFIFVSISFSIASAFLFVFLVWPVVHNPPPTVSREEVLLFVVFFAGFGSVPAFTNSKTILGKTSLGLWWAAIVLALLKIADFMLFVSSTRGAGPAAGGVGYIILLLAPSLFCDLSYIVLTRWILRRISKIDRVREIVLEVLVSLLILATLLCAPIIFGVRIGRYFPLAGGVLLVSIVLNSVDLVVGFAALILALLLLLHRLFWPTVGRSIYAIQRFGLIKNKKLLWVIGITLVFLPRHSITGLFKSLLEKL